MHPRAARPASSHNRRLFDIRSQRSRQSRSPTRAPGSRTNGGPLAQIATRSEARTSVTEPLQQIRLPLRYPSANSHQSSQQQCLSRLPNVYSIARVSGRPAAYPVDCRSTTPKGSTLSLLGSRRLNRQLCGQSAPSAPSPPNPGCLSREWPRGGGCLNCEWPRGGGCLNSGRCASGDPRCDFRGRWRTRGFLELEPSWKAGRPSMASDGAPCLGSRAGSGRRARLG